MLSGRLQGFIPPKLAHFEEHILALHKACTWKPLEEGGPQNQSNSEVPPTSHSMSMADSVSKYLPWYLPWCVKVLVSPAWLTNTLSQ
jgi:hypothetical protein